ncbi:MAG: hypothetical protein DI601_26660 [Azospirillum brasilense]|nr:MAG: hypothetical protein DI601_26660 [Azospirillum brasilense]
MPHTAHRLAAPDLEPQPHRPGQRHQRAAVLVADPHRHAAGRTQTPNRNQHPLTLRPIPCRQPAHPTALQPPTPQQRADHQTANFANLEKKTAHAAEQLRPDVAAKREVWFEAQLDLDPERLVFIDDDQRLHQDGTALWALETRNPLPGASAARALEDNHLHRRAALVWPDRADGAGRRDDGRVVHRLCTAGSGTHPAHKGAAVREAVQATGATLRFLPPYSPDFNPIENAFSKLKALLRKAASRTIDALWNAIRDALPQFSPQECASYFTAAVVIVGRSAMGKPAVTITLSEAEHRELESLARARKTGQAMARRARIVLAAAAGLENKAIGAEVGADANTVSK